MVWLVLVGVLFVTLRCGVLIACFVAGLGV